MADPKLPPKAKNGDFARLKACAEIAVIGHGPPDGNFYIGDGFWNGTTRVESVDPRMEAVMRQGRPVREGEVLKTVDVTIAPPLPDGGGAGLPVDIDINIVKPGYSAHLGGVDATRTSRSTHAPGEGLEFRSDPALGAMQAEASLIRTEIDSCMEKTTAPPVKKPFSPFRP